MAYKERPLRELDCSNVATEWQNWKEDFLMYLMATGQSTEMEGFKMANLLWLLGRDG